MLFCVARNQSRPWPLLREGFSPAPREQRGLIWKLHPRVAVQERQAGYQRECTRAYARYPIGPLKPMTFSFAKPTTDFTLQLPWGQLCISFFHFALISLSLSFRICCVSGRSAASNRSRFTGILAAGNRSAFGKTLRCHLRYVLYNFYTTYHQPIADSGENSFQWPIPIISRYIVSSLVYMPLFSL